MNKNRGSYRPAKAEVRLCMAVVQGRECKFGDGCKYSHDLVAYRTTCPPDLGELCPIYSVNGYCRFGVTCRFGGAHGASNTPPAQPVDSERNVAPAALTSRLRKHEYDFSGAAHALRQWDAINEHRKPSEGQEAGAAAAAQAAAAQAQAGASDGPAPAVDGPGKEESARAEGATGADAAEGLEGGCTAGGGGHYPSGSVATRERRAVDWRGKLYLAPLTTVGNLPYRRVCKGYGADITCSEMAMATNLLQGQASEWALLRRHVSEDVFGVQIAGNSAETMARVAQLIEAETEVDFVDINMGCPIDLVCNRGMGAGLAQRANKVQGIVRVMSQQLSCPLTVKLRTGYDMDKPTAHRLVPQLPGWGAAAVTLHGRSRQQRYTKLADWDYISQCASACPAPLIGNGDAFSYEDVDNALKSETGISSVMLARGALVKPWLFTEVKERRHWDISASERLDMLRGFVRFGLEHWGTDTLGVARTRNFLLEWLSFLHRYVPVGLLERLPCRINERPPTYFGRNDLETLMASSMASDWVKISEMLLGPVPADFHFTPKHKANAAASAAITAEG